MISQRLLAGLVAFLLSLPLLAATVEQRSPFRQGHWWDPSRAGHGFEILNTETGVLLVWYTYDPSGSPVWYTAQGPRSRLGTILPLQKHRWADGRIADTTDVGNVMLTVEHFEKLRASWQILTPQGWTQGTWLLEPFVQSGTINEVDLTGHWYDPARSGWGMTLLDQGDVFGAVVYAYDAAGEPTWTAGFHRGLGTRVPLFKTRGTCPSCPYQPITTEPAGSIEIDWRVDTQATVRGAPSIALAPGLHIDGAELVQVGRPASTRRVDYQLAPFGSAASLKAYLVAGLENRQIASSGANFSAAPPAPPASTFSSTNLQEAGVDEADVVKSDGRFVYSIVKATTTGMKVGWRVADVGAGGHFVAPVGRFDVYAPDNPWYVDMRSELYLHEGRLVTLATTTPHTWSFGWYYSPPVEAATHVEILDVAQPASPARIWRARISGSIISSRRIGDRLYLVTRFTPNLPGYVQRPWTEAQRASNAALIAAAAPEALLPTISVNDGAPVPLLTPGAVHAPQLGGNVPVADLVVVTAIDLRSPHIADTLALIGRSEALYVSSSHLYLASTRYDLAAGASATAGGSLYNTDIHQIRIGEQAMAFVGSGSIEGLVGWGEKASFRFGEHGGTLAVVSSLISGWWGINANRVTLLQPSSAAPGTLKTVSYLPNARRPEPLGKPNERVYGTRFVGDKLYAVTFRQIDPLYIVDLADKADPRITGELELPGFSDYLHPLPNGLLLGFGRDATSQGVMQGLHLTLFDVSGQAPRVIDQAQIGKRGSDSALFGSHHAFSALALASGSTRVAFPAAVHDGAADPWGWYHWQYSGLLRFEVRGSTPGTARLVPLPALVTVHAPDNMYGGNDARSWGLGRSVLFPDASIYLGEGRIWHLDDRTGVTSGPY